MQCQQNIITVKVIKTLVKESGNSESSESTCDTSTLSPCSSRSVLTSPLLTPLIKCNDSFKGQRSHPLQSKWCFCVHQLHQDEELSAYPLFSFDADPLCSFDTIEGFWRFFNAIKPPSKLSFLKMSLFRDGITPTANDFRQGGGWVVTSSDTSLEKFDQLWCLVLINLIGEIFPFGLQCGASVSRCGRLSEVTIWMQDVSCASTPSVVGIGVWLRKLVREAGCPEDLPISFHSFAHPSSIPIALDDVFLRCQAGR